MTHNKPLISPLNDYAFKLLFGDMCNIPTLEAFLKRLFTQDTLGIVDVRGHTTSGRGIHVEVQVDKIPFFRERILF